MAGSYIGTASEYKRHAWKRRAENQGHLYTEGLFRFSRHVNYFGDLLVFCGFGLLTRQPWTVIVPLVLFVLTRLAGSGILFGWAKPVPVNFHRLRSPWRDMSFVALAGPFSNLLLACLFLGVGALAAIVPVLMGVIPQDHALYGVLDLAEPASAGKWRALAERQTYNAVRLASAAAEAELAKGLRSLGYEVGSNGKGSARIASISPELANEF